MNTAGSRAIEWGLWAFVSGTAITAIFLVGPKVLVPRLRRTFLAPGEWLWIILGVEAGVRILWAATEILAEWAIIGAPMIGGSANYYEMDDATVSLLRRSHAIAIATLRAALAVVACLSLKSVRFAQWQVVLACLAIVFALESFGHAWFALWLVSLSLETAFLAFDIAVHVNNGTLRVFPGAVLLIVLLVDWKARNAFPWKHWIGPFVFLGGLVMTASFLLGWP